MNMLQRSYGKAMLRQQLQLSAQQKLMTLKKFPKTQKRPENLRFRASNAESSDLLFFDKKCTPTQTLS